MEIGNWYNWWWLGTYWKLFFKTQDEAKAFKEHYERTNTKADGSYIPTIRSIDYYFEENDFNNLKDEMTISQYEDLFNTNLKANNKLELEDLETVMKAIEDFKADIDKLNI